MIALGEAAVLLMRWLVLVMGNRRSSLDGWRLFKYLSLIVLHVKKELLVSVVWWFASPYVDRLMKVAVRRCKLQKLAQCIPVIKVFFHSGGTGSVNDQASHNRLCQLTNGTQDTEKTIRNRIFEREAAEGGISVDILATLTQPIQQEEPHNTESIVDGNHPQLIQQEQPGSAESILHPQPVQQERPRSTESILDANHLQPVSQDQPRSTESTLDANNLGPIQQEQSRWTESILDANQVVEATESLLRSMEENRRQILPLSVPQPDWSDSDGGSSSSSDNEKFYYWHAPMNSLEAGDAILVVTGFIQMLQEKSRGLSSADAAEMVRTVFIHAPESDTIYRLSDVNENQWILHAGTETFVCPPASNRFVMMSKITAKLSHLIWLELAGQNWQLCQEVRKECFLEIVGQSLQKFGTVAVLFCKASWPADCSLQMLTMFDGLADVLYTIRDLPHSRSYSIHDELPYIFDLMMSAIKRVIRGTADAIHDSNESTIHPTTVVLLGVLDFLCRNRDMVQHLLDSGHCKTDPCSYIFDYWVKKLNGSATNVFRNKGQSFIFILNNLYFVVQKKRNQGAPPNMDSQIKQHIESYLDECWVPVMGNLDGETKQSSLVNFTRNFGNTCRMQKKWKVRTQLKKILRDRIENLIVAKHEILLDTLQANPRWRWPFRLKVCRARSQKPIALDEVQQEIRDLFEL